MSLRTLLALALCLNVAARVVDTQFNPAKSVQVLDAVEEALRKMTSLPHLSAAQLSSAKKVTDDVHRIVSEIESNKSLSEKAKGEKVGNAIKELEGLQTEWDQAVAMAAKKAKAADEKYFALKNELDKKEELLAKDEKMLTITSLEKELDEKKLKLAQAQAQAREQANKEDARQQDVMVAKLVNMAKAMSATKTQPKAAAATRGAAKKDSALKSGVLKPILANLQERAQNITAFLKKMDVTEQKHEAELNALVEKKAASLTKGKGSAEAAKTRSMLKSVVKQETRKYKKARASKQSELNELKEAIKSIEKGDVKALQNTMLKMQRDVKAMQSNSKSFLY